MNSSYNIRCAQDPCSKCEKAGRTSWRSRVSWHAEKLRKRARLRRFAVRSVVFGVPLALIGIWVGMWLRVVTSG